MREGLMMDDYPLSLTSIVERAERLSPQRNLYTLLSAADIRRLQPEPHYGLTIALGSAEVSLEDFTG